MILKALYDYYHRSGDDVAPFGLEYKEIGFIIVIDRCGKFLRFEDRRIDKKSAQRFLVKKSVSRSSAPVANYLYDNCKYVFGYSDKGDMEKIRKYFEVFKAKVKDIYDENLFNNKDVYKTSVGTERQDELFEYANVPSYMKQPIKSNYRDEIDKDDDFDIGF